VDPITAEFPFDDEIVLLNHASFGLPTTHLLNLAEQLRRRIERDAARFLDTELLAELRAEAAVAANLLAAPRESLALTTNATEGASAVAASLARPGPIRVAMLDTEYPSVVRAWQLATAPHGGSVQMVHLDVPVDAADTVVEAFDRQVSGPLDVVVVSLITSPTALRLPVERMANWAAGRGAMTVVDAAHAPGHLEVAVPELGAAVVYGTLHKWLPVPRPLGFLYANEEMRDVIRPAAVALDWDGGFFERFAWRGTWDPAPALCLSAAIRTWRAWEAAALLASADRMADLATEQLSACGLRPTGAGPLVPPRLRAFIVPGVHEDELQAALGAVNVRAWVGVSPTGRTLLRISTHVYTTETHLHRIVEAVDTARRRLAKSKEPW
jgi:isopenicillin-N epimerase